MMPTNNVNTFTLWVSYALKIEGKMNFDREEVNIVEELIYCGTLY